ncbi:hypothetical protein [Streptomyces chiangmaiensis]|uniref:Secreted protein n=1 Tax=Streptomyces chiangmaiensis TaxID=766497 RepID=A0ABU7FGH2_9ACTN|nr:hypothetical protein [Streptomyces chiangmaiensis]MED7823217.1 hypothetical protein [Streptomyces chiangmaiensis]
MTGRTQALAGGATFLVTAGVMALYLATVGLEEAAMWATVLGLFVSLASLAATMGGIWRERRAPSGQSVHGSAVGGGITQVSGTGGNVRITRRGHTATPPGPIPPTTPSGTATPEGDGQSVRDSGTAGPVDQVRNTGGDVDIEGP